MIFLTSRTGRTGGTLALVLAVLIAALAVCALYAGRLVKDVTIVSAKERGTEVSLKRLEETLKDEFIYTHLTPENGSAEAFGIKTNVRICLTGADFARTSGNRILSGSFFTETAQKNEYKHLVLGEKAARDIFGSFNIAGQQIKLGEEIWEVVGVVADGDKDNRNIYRPTPPDAEVGTLVVLPGNSGRVGLEALLKSLGIYDTTHTFYSTADVKSLMYHRLFAACLISGALVFAAGALKAWGRARYEAKFLYRSLEHCYVAELPKVHPEDTRRALFNAVVCVICTVAAVRLGLDFLERALRIFPIEPDFFTPLPDIMTETYKKLKYTEFASQAGFLIFIAALVLVPIISVLAAPLGRLIEIFAPANIIRRMLGAETPLAIPENTGGQTDGGDNT